MQKIAALLLAGTFIVSPKITSAEMVDLCLIGKPHPGMFNGKMITIRGTTFHSPEHSGLFNDRCEIPIHLVYPGGEGIKVSFGLKKDKEWDKFSHYDSFNTGVLTGFDPKYYKVTATFHGLFQYFPAVKGSNFFTLRLVVESVSDVSVEKQ